ncbi:hypothetical protein N9137_01625 [Pseudomonadales bacterium]|nr:hypothetical protein [Pseudomonadales bacterium]
MNKIIITLSALFSITAVAQDVPNTFQPGSPIVASEVNENFQSVKSRIDVLEAQLQTIIDVVGSANSDAPQIVGFTERAVFGGLGLSAGKSMCQSVDVDSHVCSLEELTQASSYSALSNADAMVLYNASVDKNLCSNFREIITRAAGVFIQEVPERLFPANGIGNIAVTDNSSSAALIKSISSFNNDTCDGYGLREPAQLNRYNTCGTQIVFNPCNTALQAACCK